MLSLFRAIRRHSVTFALVFAGIWLGAPIHRMMRQGFGQLPLDGILVFVLPFVAIALLARFEHRLLPDPVIRKRFAWGIVIFAFALRWLLGRLTADAGA